MEKAMTLTYEGGNNLYINVTNRCPCACIFCIRNNGDGAYGSDPLWLEHEPTIEEMKANLNRRNLAEYSEIVFCGYGEPLMRLEFVCELAAYIRELQPDVCLRLNTNGLADLFNPEEALADGTTAAAKVSALFDKVSISLNGGSAEVYNRVTNPRGGGEKPFATMLAFAKECKEADIDVMFTIVNVLSVEEIAEAKTVADEMGIVLSVREWIH